MEKKILIQKFWNLVNQAEDYYSTGFKTGHPEVKESLPEQKDTGETVIPPEKRFEILKQKITICKNCYLHYSRTHALPGEGNLHAQLFIVGNGPNEEEDAAGRPFAGEPGNYLDKWLSAIQLNMAEHCFACTIVRCRPPQNRDPGMDETSACFPYIDEQVSIIKPEVILCLGRIPGQVLTGKLTTSVSKLRSLPFFYKGIPVIVTYHPVAVLKDQTLRKPVWEDMKRLKMILEKQAQL